MKFRELAEYLDRLEKTSSRIEITKILAELYKKIDNDETTETTYLLLGYLVPSYKGIVFNLAERMMLQTISKAYGIEPEKVRSEYKLMGDLGNLSMKLSGTKKLKNEKTKELSIKNVYGRLMNIAKDQGEGSQERKINAMAKLLSELDSLSAKFVARIPVGRLRLGFSYKTIIDALSWMETGGKSKSKRLEEAYVILPDVGMLAKSVKQSGIERAVKDVKPVVGVPVLPMLAQRLKSPKDMITKMGRVYVEPKFDGLRVLIHFDRNRLKKSQLDSARASNGTPMNARSAIQSEEGWWVGGVKAYTRNLNNVVDMFPELQEVGNYLNAKEVILDSEAIGMDPEMKRMVDFQTTMQRRRKYNIEEKSRSVPLRFQVFDIILKDGRNLMNIPYFERREVLKDTVKNGNLLVVDEAVITDDPEVINRQYRLKVKEGLEGVIVKKYDTEYIPGRTGWRWVKMKEEESATGKLADTVDCIVMGYTAGKGKRASFGLGQFLVGVRDKDEIKTVTKVGTGLTDEQFKELKVRLRDFEIKEKPKNFLVNKLLEPDYWVEPNIVVEIAADEITISPTHSAGLALRFPRLVRFRDDKSWEEATTSGELKKLYKLQGKRE